MRVRAFYRDAVFVMGLYNVVIGALFFFFHQQVFELFRVEAYAPAHAPTLQIPALFLFVFGIGYLLASLNLIRNHVVLFVGLLQNACVTGLCAWYWFVEPDLVPKAYFLPAGLSALFALVFLLAWITALFGAGRERRQARVSTVSRAPRPAVPPAVPQPSPLDPEIETVEVEEPEPTEALSGRDEPAGPEEPETTTEEPEAAPDEPRREGTVTAPEPEKPEEEPLRLSLAHRDRSGIPPVEGPICPAP